ncbi:MAG: hypothetical protein R2834_11795 [Rhodothermales bacterium]
MRYALLLLALAGCHTMRYPAGSLVAGDPVTVWMRTDIAVDRPCNPDAPEPAGLERELEARTDSLLLQLADVDVAVYENQTLPRPTCRSCDCDAPGGRLYIRVPAERERLVHAMGFQVGVAPAAEW